VGRAAKNAAESLFEGGNHNGLAGVSKTAEGLKKPFCGFEAHPPHRQGLFKLRSMPKAVALKIAALILILPLLPTISTIVDFFLCCWMPSDRSRLKIACYIFQTSSCPKGSRSLIDSKIFDIVKNSLLPRKGLCCIAYDLCSIVFFGVRRLFHFSVV